MYPEPDETTKMRKNNNSYGGNSYFLLIIRKADNGSVLVIILQGNIFVELRTNLDHGELRTMCNTETSKSDQLLCLQPEKLPPSTEHALEMVSF